MEEEFQIIRQFPKLKPFVLTNVRSTGVRIGGGVYSNVEEVKLVGAAKMIVHDAFVNVAKDQDAASQKSSTQFVEECQLLSTLRHPNIVQFLGVAFGNGSRLPALIMERLMTSLYDLLAPDPQPQSDAVTPLPFFSMALKCSVLHDAACGLAYLHDRSPPIIHRNLSAKNILLNSQMVAKITDLRMARSVSGIKEPTVMTKAPGNSLYMPPEASEDALESKYNASIDVFSFGVISIFTIGEKFPCHPLAPNYEDSKGSLVARTELQRRSKYMEDVNEQLRACGQQREDHPLIQLIQQCLHNSSPKRPDIREVLLLLEEARVGIRDEDSERKKYQLVHALHTQLRNQSTERVYIAQESEVGDSHKDKEITGLGQRVKEVIQELVAENADVQFHVKELKQLLQPANKQLVVWEGDVEGEKDSLRKELREAQARIGELEQRLEEVERREHKRLVIQQQAIAAEQRGPSWEVKGDELEVTDEELGCGGWAKVRVAKLKVAAKCLHDQLVFDYHQEKFKREMDVAAKVSHPNLLRFLGARLDGGMTILTEYMPTSLRYQVNRRPQQRLSLKNILSIAIDVARALNYLHNMTPEPIIHRDLSSANVLLQPSPDGGWLAKVSDYGTANFLSQLKTQNPGSPVYTAPESHNAALQTPKMDIYSFGVLLIEIYTCGFPTPECRGQLMKSIDHPRFLALIKWCLNDDKDQRPTAAQLVDLLVSMQ